MTSTAPSQDRRQQIRVEHACAATYFRSEEERSLQCSDRRPADQHVAANAFKCDNLRSALISNSKRFLEDAAHGLARRGRT